MRYHDRGLNVAYLPVDHPFTVLTQNCGGNRQAKITRWEDSYCSKHPVFL